MHPSIVAVVAAVVTYGIASSAIFASGTSMTVASTTAANMAAGQLGAVAVTATAAPTGLLAGAVSSGAISATTASVVAGAVGGAVANVAGELAATGKVEDLGDSLLSGAIMGGVGGAFGPVQSVERVVTTAAAGGIAAELTGGEFAQGALMGGAQALATWGFDQMRQSTDENALRAAATAETQGDRDLAAAMRRVDAQGTLQTAGATYTLTADPLTGADYSQLGPDWLNFNPLTKGLNRFLEGRTMARQGSGLNWFEKSTFFGLPTGGIDGPINRFYQMVSKTHDWFNGSWGYNHVAGGYISRGPFYDSLFSTFSFAGMVPAAAVSSAAQYPNGVVLAYRTRRRDEGP